jgi:hypothetical protein
MPPHPYRRRFQIVSAQLAVLKRAFADFPKFPFSETHHFAAVTQSSARPKISQKIGLKTSSETRLLAGKKAKLNTKKG